MKILCINYEYPPLGGGGGVAHRDIAEALAGQHEVHVLTTHFHGLPRESVEHGVTIHRVPVWGRTELPTATIRSMLTFAPAAYRAGRPLIRQFQPDILHVFFAVPSGVPAAWLTRATGIPMVLTLIGADIFDPLPTAGIATHHNPLIRSTVRWVIRQAAAVTAISSDTRARAIATHQAPESTQVISLGLVPPTTLPDRVPTSHDQLRIVSVGRLIPRKGFADLLTALAHVPPSVRLTLIGDGPLRTALEEQADMLGIRDRIVFAGAVDEATKWKLLRSADVFVSPSLYEGFGIVFLEALYAGLPVIATDTGGHTDFLRDMHNALLVPSGQPKRLAEAIATVLQDRTLLARITNAGSGTVDNLRIQQTAAAYETLFASVLAAHHGRR